MENISTNIVTNRFFGLRRMRADVGDRSGPVSRRPLHPGPHPHPDIDSRVAKNKRSSSPFRRARQYVVGADQGRTCYAFRPAQARRPSLTIKGDGMPDFTVIEGGGQSRDWDSEAAQDHFEEFVVALLRSLAGGGASYQLTQQFFRFLEHAQKTGVPIGPVLDGAVKNLHEMAIDAAGVENYETERKNIVREAMRVAAESMAKDNAARARLSKREEALIRAVEAKVIGSEIRSRENGWSYVEHLTKHLDPKPTRRR